MRRIMLAALAFALSAMPALAQTTPAPPEAPLPPPTPDAAMRQQFEATRHQMEQIRSDERAQVLGALTPAHRALLATIAGQLATATTPDYKAATQRLDSALSAPEKQAITNASNTARQKQRSALESMRAQMPSPPKPPGRNMMYGMSGSPPTAGAILLRVALGGQAMGMMVRTGGRPGP